MHEERQVLSKIQVAILAVNPLNEIIIFFFENCFGNFFEIFFDKNDKAITFTSNDF